MCIRTNRIALCKTTKIRTMYKSSRVHFVWKIATWARDKRPFRGGCFQNRTFERSNWRRPPPAIKRIAPVLLAYNARDVSFVQEVPPFVKYVKHGRGGHRRHVQRVFLLAGTAFWSYTKHERKIAKNESGRNRRHPRRPSRLPGPGGEKPSR